MPRFFWNWIITSLTIFAIPQLMSSVHVDGFGSALAVAIVLGVLNAVVRPILIFITIPLTILSLGFFLLVINALLFQFAGSFVSGFSVDSFGSAFIAALIVSFVSWVMNVSGKKNQGNFAFHVHRGGFARPQRQEREVHDTREPRPIDVIDVTPKN